MVCAATSADTVVRRSRPALVGVPRRVRYAFVLILGVAALAGTVLAQQPFTGGTEVVVAIEALRVREAAGLEAAQVGSQRRGDRGEVVDGSPHWADGYWWWKIAFRDGVVGWSADGDSELVYLEAASGLERSPSSPSPQCRTNGAHGTYGGRVAR